jgi:cathepsin D
MGGQAPTGPSDTLADGGNTATSHDEGEAPTGDAGSSSNGKASDAGEDALGPSFGSEAGALDAESEAAVPLAAIPLSTPDGTYYTAQVTVGDQTFAMDIDTGSATCAVAGQGCASCAAAGVSPSYQPSATATDLQKTAATVYGDGSMLNGEIFQDTVTLGHGMPSVQLELLSIQSERQFFREAQFQGILGLGSTLLELRGTDTFFALETADGVSPVLAFELCAKNGTMWLGGFDATAAESPMQYTPLLPISRTNAFYSINVDDVLIGGTSLGLNTAEFESPILDTGTSLFYLPAKVFNAILSAINASSGFASLFGATALKANGCVRANGVTSAAVDAALPAMAMKLPSTDPGAPDFTLTVNPSQSYLMDTGQGQFCLAMGEGGPTQGAILGDAFLSSFVTVIDRQNAQVGFAPDLGCGSALGRRVVDLMTWRPRTPRRRVRL